MKPLRCEIAVTRGERRRRPDLAGKVRVGLVSLQSLGADVATWYLLSHGLPLHTILRVMTMPQKRRR